VYTEISVELSLRAMEGEVDLKKIGVMKFFGSVIFLANAVFCIGICASVASYSTEMLEGVIKEYDNGLQLTKDLCNFIGIPETNVVTERKEKQLKDIVVYWDCDDVLQKNTDPSLVGNKIWAFMKGEGADACKTIIWDSPKTIVESSILELTRHLKKCDIPQFVVTQCTSDPKTQLMREGILEKLGYSFKDTILKNDETFQEKCDSIKTNCQLSLKPGQTSISFPKFSNGIAYAGSATKEVMFEWLFDLMQSSGKFCDIADVSFVFVDDKHANLEEFCKACKKRGVKRYRAYHYTNVQKQQNSASQTDKLIENLQKRSIRTGKFLSYDGARFLTEMFPLMKLEF